MVAEGGNEMQEAAIRQLQREHPKKLNLKLWEIN